MFQGFEIENNIHFEEANDFVMIKFDKVNDINEKEKCLIFNDKSYFPKDFGLKNVDRDDSKLATAYHIPQGTLMIYSPKYSTETDLKPFNTSISTLDILPSILKNYGIKESSYMNKGLVL